MRIKLPVEQNKESFYRKVAVEGPYIFTCVRYVTSILII